MSNPGRAAHHPEDDPEVPLDGCGELARDFVLFTKTPDAVRPLLGPGLEERLEAIWKPYLENRGPRGPACRHPAAWIEPADVRPLLDQAVWILDDLERASPR